MRSGHTITRESAEKLKELLDRQRYQPPKRYINTRPFGGTGGGGGVIEYTVASVELASSGPYTGLKIATAIIHGAPFDRTELIGESVEVVDHSGCIFDEDNMEDYTGWASEMVFLSLDPYADCGDLTPRHWTAINRCCAPGSGNYADGCEGGGPPDPIDEDPPLDPLDPGEP
jgi:hypothetical protein